MPDSAVAEAPPQGEAQADTATQTPTVSEEVLDRWDNIGKEDTTPPTAGEAGSGEAGTTAGEAPAVGDGDQPAGEAKDDAAPPPPTAPPSGSQAFTPNQKQLHTLERAGLSVDDLKALPEKAKQTLLSKLEKNYRDLGTRWAELGGKLQAGQQQPPPAAAAPAAGGAPQGQQQPPAAPAEGEPQELAIDYGFDEKLWGIEGKKGITAALDKVVKPLLSKVAYLERQARTREDDALRGVVMGFFDKQSKDFADYGDTKGDWKKLTEAQRASRKKVADLGDRIMVGAAAEGVRLSELEALQQAHDAITAGERLKNQRQQITGQIRQRGNQMISRHISRNPQGQFASAEERAADAWSQGLKAAGLSDGD